MVDHGRIGRFRTARRAMLNRCWGRSNGSYPDLRTRGAYNRLTRAVNPHGPATIPMTIGNSAIARTARNAAARGKASRATRSDATMLHDYLYNNGSMVTINLCDENGAPLIEANGEPSVIIVDRELAENMLRTIASKHRAYTIQEIIMDTLTRMVEERDKTM